MVDQCDFVHLRGNMLMKRDAALDGWLLRCISHLTALKVIRIQCYNMYEFMG